MAESYCSHVILIHGYMHVLYIAKLGHGNENQGPCTATGRQGRGDRAGTAMVGGRGSASRRLAWPAARAHEVVRRRGFLPGVRWLTHPSARVGTISRVIACRFSSYSAGRAINFLYFLRGGRAGHAECPPCRTVPLDSPGNRMHPPTAQRCQGHINGLPATCLSGLARPVRLVQELAVPCPCIRPGKQALATYE